MVARLALAWGLLAAACNEITEDACRNLTIGETRDAIEERLGSASCSDDGECDGGTCCTYRLQAYGCPGGCPEGYECKGRCFIVYDADGKVSRVPEVSGSCELPLDKQLDAGN